MPIQNKAPEIHIIVSAKKNNDISFRRISKEILSKSFSEIDFHDSLETSSKMLGVGIVHAIKKAKGKYKAGSFAKSFNNISHADRVTSSDLRMVLKFIDGAELDAVLKLLNHNRKFGFKSCLNMLK